MSIISEFCLELYDILSALNDLTCRRNKCPFRSKLVENSGYDTNINISAQDKNENGESDIKEDPAMSQITYSTTSDRR